jgi:hypothetical protein
MPRDVTRKVAQHIDVEILEEAMILVKSEELETPDGESIHFNAE